ncbi:MAG: hypothetical protein AMDU5_GPLC00004G0285 [Thermoplasmatales archaeon Gpl]|jgi:hypothetical protein|nr:MAG: hypothetical protein AMDU5_GPLC00004G0285 [Thermoplasmatales archaeon Gpl]
MTDRLEDRDGTYVWSRECPDRYEIILYFRNGMTYDVPKYVKETICFYAELNKKTLKDYIWSKPKELQGLFYNQTMDNLVDVKIKDKNDYMEKTLQRFVDGSVNKYLDKKSKNIIKGQAKLPESEGHIKVKNDVVEYLKTLGVEPYPEIVFYENAFSDYYKWQREEWRSKQDADGVFGYGSVGFGNYKQTYGQHIKVDVAGWIDDSYGKFDYPVLAVEVMKSSNLREEVNNLNKIHGSSVVFAVVVDAYGELSGQINGIPVVSLDTFKNGITKRIEMIRDAVKERKSLDEIFEIGKKFNTGKLD